MRLWFAAAAFLLLGATFPQAARCAPRAGSKRSAEAWLSAGDEELLRRSYLRCLREGFRKIGHPITDEMLARQFRLDMEDVTHRLEHRDIVEAPRVNAARIHYIACEWFNRGKPFELAE